VTLQHEKVGLRPLRLRDASAWVEVRTRNEGWLAPWEGRPAAGSVGSWAERHTSGVFVAMVRALRREAKAGRGLPFAVTFEDRLAGQVTLSGLTRGAFDSAWLGYWVDERVAGRGVAPTAIALAVDHCFDRVGLHRVEANVRPENARSRRVVEKLGFAPEGMHRRYLFIDGAWRDHTSYALLREDVPEGVLHRFLGTAVR